MWVIKDKNSTIYLFGTIHILRNTTAWNSPKIKQAVGESTELWLEIAGGESEAPNLLAKYGLDPENPLSKRLNAEQHARLVKTAESYTFPMPLLEPMKPWYAAMTLTMLPIFKAGYNPNAGVEPSLTLQARLEGRQSCRLRITRGADSDDGRLF